MLVWQLTSSRLIFKRVGFFCTTLLYQPIAYCKWPPPNFLSSFFVFWWVVIDKVAFRGWESSSCTPVGPALGSEG
ncbi:hypothetical protein NC653_016207 [Populus alba x Populus x berolinensis]|uniref:Uncharacterized protein n=1 Tax=Populus alba x Populus x berolinensis TaxID=444605 RepID=A0AAD6QMA7_9ROSI|nr:hypothetical protein NC653_016207 [Populus alba x Populus x berolinensis]